MKKARLAKMLELIEEYEIDTQEAMLSYLQSYGFNVTQATVSRDIRELKLSKVLTESGKHKYIAVPVDSNKQERLDSIFRSSVISVDYAVNTVVIKCDAGMAQAACASFDAMNYDGVMGSLAGDDTIFVLTKSEQCASELVKNLSRNIKST
ncbi:MAG: hypothetical protein E7507_00835 [Ruminococcus sp.]|nr:hypothetical protein [Ruminococcus sp.]